MTLTISMTVRPLIAFSHRNSNVYSSTRRAEDVEQDIVIQWLFSAGLSPILTTPIVYILSFAQELFGVAPPPLPVPSESLAEVVVKKSDRNLLKRPNVPAVSSNGPIPKKCKTATAKPVPRIPNNYPDSVKAVPVAESAKTTTTIENPTCDILENITVTTITTITNKRKNRRPQSKNKKFVH